MDELQQFLEENYAEITFENINLSWTEIAAELSARVNDVYALNPNDEQRIRAQITDILIAHGDLPGEVEFFNKQTQELQRQKSLETARRLSQ